LSKEMYPVGGIEVPIDNIEVRDSVLGRLLQECSWTGAKIRDFHNGGLGFENVLTAEALTALDFLPRTDFLGRACKPPTVQPLPGRRRLLRSSKPRSPCYPMNWF
jgi:hypothetical protein